MKLMTANYTFLNERLAMHYGIENVKGASFRKVTLKDEVAMACSARVRSRCSRRIRIARRLCSVARGSSRRSWARRPVPPALVPTLQDNKRGEVPKTLRARLKSTARTRPASRATA